jgi:hypothetical protein
MQDQLIFNTELIRARQMTAHSGRRLVYDSFVAFWSARDVGLLLALPTPVGFIDGPDKKLHAVRVAVKGFFAPSSPTFFLSLAARRHLGTVRPANNGRKRTAYFLQNSQGEARVAQGDGALHCRHPCRASLARKSLDLAADREMPRRSASSRREHSFACCS